MNSRLSTGSRGQAAPADLVDFGGGSSAAGEIYFIHPVGGDVYCYLPLARRLTGQWACRGFQSPLLSDPVPGAASLHHAAERYGTQLAAGPVLLAGWSLGGVIAFELARQRELAGQPVAGLVLIDAPPPGARQEYADAIEGFAVDFAHSVGDPAAVAAVAAVAGREERLRTLVSLLQAHAAGVTSAEVERRLRVFEAYHHGFGRYRAAGPVAAATLLVSGTDDRCGDWAPHLTGRVARHRLAADHYQILRVPAVVALADLIAGWIEAREAIGTGERSDG